MKLELRPTIIVDVPLIATELLSNPEQIIIKFPHAETADIGSLCYLITDKDKRLGKKDVHLGRLVEPESIIDSRRNQIRKLIKIISDQLNFGSRTSITLKNLVDTFITFIRWSDQNKFNNALEDYENTMKIFMTYSNFLDNQYSKGEICLKHSATQKARVLKFISIYFEQESINYKANDLKVKNIVKKVKFKNCKNIKKSIDYEIRPTQIINLPFEENINTFLVEQSIIMFPNRKTIDIGFLCYLNAGSLKSIKNKNVRLVQLKSLSEARTSQVRKLINLISDQLKINSLSVETIHNHWSRFVNFMRWADENKFHNVLDCPVMADNIINLYSEYLSNKFNHQEISLKHTTLQLLSIMNTLSTFFDGHDFRHKINRLKVLNIKKKLISQSKIIVNPSIKYEIRPTKIIDLPLNVEKSLLNPEQVIIRFSNGKSVDIGALCYLKVEPLKDYNQGTARYQKRGRLVQLESLSESRRYLVRKLIKHITDLLENSGRRVETIKDMISRFIAFMRWADENNYHEVLDSVENAKKIMVLYLQFFKEKFLRNEISLKHAGKQPSTVINFLSEFFEVDSFSHGMFLLRQKYNVSTATQPPSEDAQTRLLALCNALFNGISSLVVDFKSYPYKLTLPDFLQFPDNFLWVFPAESWFKSPEIALLKRKICLGFNYSTGELNTLDEIVRLRGHSLRGDEKIIINAQNNIDAANSNFRDSQRMHVGTVALNAFVVLFLAQTGMNWAQLVNLTWSEDYNIESGRQLFRTIKWRAGGKECFFELPSNFMPFFKRYLQLRGFLLGNQSCDWLFFKLGERGLGSPSQIKDTLSNFYKSLKKIDPDLTEIHSRQWRAAKSDWLICNTDISTTALILQNSEKTVLSSYIAGSETKQWEEMSNFLNQVSDVVRDKKEKTKDITLRAVGGCSSFGEPNTVSRATSIASNCIEPEGCLFCDKFRIHVDEVDIRKLLSCRYCVRKTAHLAGDQEIFQNLIQPILNRIEDIINEITKYNKDLLEKIRHEVDEQGELESYWRRKLEMFMELGVIL